MADKTKIEWTDATWNPITGCSVASPGCTNCYAMKLAGTRLAHHESRAGLTVDSKAGPVWTGEVRFNEQWLDQPLRWKKPRMIFVCAHADLFHESVPDEWIDRVFAVMALCPHHTFQVLTKRSARMRSYLGNGRDACERVFHQVSEFASYSPAIKDAVCNTKWGEWKARWPLPNVWLGVSVEDQACADERIPDLLATPAVVRFISAEPLLGPINLTSFNCNHRGLGMYWVNALTGAHDDMCRPCESVPKLNWVIVGGENGPRPMHPDWARSIRDQCEATGVAFYFKQWGAWLPWEPEHGPCWKAQNGKSEDHHVLFPADMDTDPNWDDGLWAIPEDEHFAFQRVGKKRAGRLLDGVQHDGWPG